MVYGLGKVKGNTEVFPFYFLLPYAKSMNLRLRILPILGYPYQSIYSLDVLLTRIMDNRISHI